MGLRKELIRLAKAKPELRKDLLPLIKKASYTDVPSDERELVDMFKHGEITDWELGNFLKRLRINPRAKSVKVRGGTFEKDDSNKYGYAEAEMDLVFDASPLEDYLMNTSILIKDGKLIVKGFNFFQEVED